MDALKRWLSPQDLATEFGISKSTQNKMRMDDKIPYSKIGRFIKYDRVEIDKWLEDAKMS